MNILHLLDEPWDSGLTAYAIDLARLQVDHGHFVVMGVRPEKKPEQIAKKQGIDTLSVDSFFSLIKVLKRQSWDVVNVHTGRTHTWAALCLALGFYYGTRPVLARTRGDARPIGMNPGSSLIYKRTDVFIAASEHISNQLKQVYPSLREKVFVIYPSVRFADSLAPIPDKPVVGILGRLDPIKGHTIFLEAAARVLERIPEARFLVAGKEAGISLALFKNQVSQLGLESSIEFLGYQNSVLDFMNQCSIGVIASIGSEEISRAALEWMSAGRPVIATMVGCLPELIETEENGILVPPEDFVALADAIIEMLKSSSKLSRFGIKARELALKKFHSDVFYSQTQKAYQDQSQVDL